MRIPVWFSPNTRYSAELKAVIIDVMEMNRVRRPIINLFGKAYRKSSSAYRAVRIDKNVRMAAVDEKRERASETAKMMKAFSTVKIGYPLSPFPPGTVMAAAKTTVAMSAATTEHEFAVSFIHFSPSITRSLCASVNTIEGVFPSPLVTSLYAGYRNFSTSYR